MSKPREMPVTAPKPADKDALAFLRGGEEGEEPPVAVTPDTSAPKAKAAAKKTPRPPSSSNNAPPWADAGDGRKQVILAMTERTKSMLDFIKQETQIPSQAWVRSRITEIIEDEAERLWKERRG